MSWSSNNEGHDDNKKVYLAGGAVVLALIFSVAGFMVTSKLMNHGTGGTAPRQPGVATPQATLSAEAQPLGSVPVAPAVAEEPRAGDAAGRAVSQQRLAQTEEIENETRQRMLRAESERKQREARRQNILRNAKRMIDKGQGEKTKGRLEEIVRDDPGTPEAEEATRLLRTIAK
jgi:hypothetical protein